MYTMTPQEKASAYAIVASLGRRAHTTTSSAPPMVDSEFTRAATSAQKRARGDTAYVDDDVVSGARCGDGGASVVVVGVAVVVERAGDPAELDVSVVHHAPLPDSPDNVGGDAYACTPMKMRQMRSGSVTAAATLADVRIISCSARVRPGEIGSLHARRPGARDCSCSAWRVINELKEGVSCVEQWK
jgi:hypothetical protein